MQRRVRAVVIGNCGTLTAGIPLMPAAIVDDGWLDVVIVSPRTVLGWLGVSTSVITRTRNPAVEHARCRSVEIRAERPLHVQLDGDTAGTAKVMRASVDPLALVDPGAGRRPAGSRRARARHGAGFRGGRRAGSCTRSRAGRRVAGRVMLVDPALAARCPARGAARRRRCAGWRRPRPAGAARASSSRTGR